MKNRAFLSLLLGGILLMGGQVSSPLQRPDIRRDLDLLLQRGFTCRMPNNDVIELTDPQSGETHTKNLREPSEAEIRTWAAQRGIPILEIDPNTIDTSKYTDWYTYWTTVPLGNSIGVPLIIGDVNHNSEPDVYGSYLDTLSTEYQTRVYEVNDAGDVFMRFNYVPRPGVSRQIADVDGDSLSEIVFSTFGIVSGYKQNSRDSLPNHRTFAHDRYYHNSSPGYTGIYIGSLDGDSLTDFLYQGTGPDPTDTNIAISKTYIAEYDPSNLNFMRVWSTQFVPGSGAAGFSVGDFDGDGKTGFVATHGGSGRVFVAEKIGDNQFATVWQDSTPFVNFYYHGSGDVDNDGMVEFFTGATMSNGNWVLVYEADSNNSYSARFLFYLLSGGLFGSPIYTTIDIEGDGRLELAMMVGADLYIFKSSVDNQYGLWYLKRESTADGVAFYDFDQDGHQDIVISKFAANSQGRGWTYADIYLASKLVRVKEEAVPSVEFQLLPNYPNPFNLKTTIRYITNERKQVTLTIYNLLGQRVALLVSDEKEVGTHTVVWNAERFASGIYLCRLSIEGRSSVRKLILIR